MRILLPLFCSLLLFSPISAFAKVALEVSVTGIEDPLLANVLAFLGIEKSKSEEELTVRWVHDLHRQAPEEIRSALQPYGYYLPDIQATLTETDDGWRARYDIDAGEPVHVSRKDIQWTGEGASNPLFEQSILDYRATSNKTLIHAEYEAAKSNFLKLALSQGYPKAKIVKNQVLVDLEKNSAEITLLIDTGPLFYFGEITFIQDFLDPNLLQKYITIKEGEPYSHDSLLEFQQNLIASNYAQEVTLTPQFGQAQDKKLPLDVLMEPIPPHKLSFGLGYETDVGIRGSARWENRLVNSHGHYSDIYLKLSQKEGTLLGQYSIPVHRALTDRWVSSTGYEYEETPDTNSNTLMVETAFVRRNLEDTHFYKGFILASYERFTVGNDPEVATNLLTLGGTYRITETEESMYPRVGHSFFADLRGAGENFFSDTTFTRLHLKGQHLLALGKNGRVTSRMEVGLAWVDNFDVYPTSLRYFAGGDNSVRGYKYESLGPTDDEGIVVGGQQVFSASIEYDQRVAESWVLDVFVDAGNAYNETMDKMYVGSGFGFRWLAPFGSLRIDLAWPVSESPAINDCRIHLGFGATL